MSIHKEYALVPIYDSNWSWQWTVENDPNDLSSDFVDWADSTSDFNIHCFLSSIPFMSGSYEHRLGLVWFKLNGVFLTFL